jgi:hypothetical protein
MSNIKLCSLGSNLRTTDTSLALLSIEASCQLEHSHSVKTGTNQAEPTIRIPLLDASFYCAEYWCILWLCVNVSGWGTRH